MNILSQIIRFIVSVTFIFSGFVKLVDPLGSAYKFEEYFGADVLNLEFLSPFALEFSIVLILAEIMLGVMLLVGFKPKFTVWSLFGISLVFLFLTWYSAYYNKVTDCGCFGDAITLTPWETFYKNIILIVFVIYLLIRVYDIQSLFSDIFAKRVSLISMLVFVGIIIYVLRYLPIVDFRAYAIGKSIPEGMMIPEDAEKPVFEDTWIYNVDGEDRVFTTEEKPWNIEGATFVDRKTRTLKEGYVPPIHDFTMEREGEDLTEQLMQKEKLMLIVAYNLRKSNEEGFKNIKSLSERALEKGFTVYCFSASTLEDYEVVKNKFQLEFDLLFCDETTLKTIVRSNPGIVTLNKGTITGKWSWRQAERVTLD
ncbi:BT_3928 family protein [Lutimonas zeaxanthinifaciens]|uniref:BT_3928 family protein n=1 Tax=Lutimonas zeaxanthinifaciens TaxID=3060215 RepID=UPI00265CACF3|nr:BT_3928 family protein [Lutimonas sp. YSD2104]WKK66761.1 DoxX family protein [Lutimonas sp. YSD2104]